jgi:hypothetical protein
MTRAICKLTLAATMGAALLGMFATPAMAQAKVAVTGGVDFSNRYNFRGIRQNIGEVSIWPFVDLGIPTFSGDGALKSVTVNVGTWNALHTEINDADFVNRDGDPTGNKWYESDLYGTLGLGFGTTTLGFTYTSYMSPANLWHNVQELAVKFSYDDSGPLGKGALKPYGLVAFELTEEGQADGGAQKGIYVELGVAPGYSASKASVAFPIKVGLSAKDYYEFGGEDDKFGYFSVGGIATVPVNANFNVHGGLELQLFGDNLRAYNGFGDDGDRKYTGIASIGIGFSY